MTNKAYLIAVRLEPKEENWFKERMQHTKKTSSDLLREIIKDRIEFEGDPFGFMARKKNEGPRKKTADGYITFIPDFPAEPQGGQK